MKLLFSESKPDSAHYIYPYAVWAFPEAHETAADLFDSGFLPSARNLERFYLCRHLRVALAQYEASSENRRILRKGAGLSPRLVARADFDYSAQQRQFFKAYADARFGPNTLSEARLDSLLAGKITSHLLLFSDSATGAAVGAATLYLQEPRLAYYYYAFYDLAYLQRNLGMFMMTWAVGFFAECGFEHLYLGSCYSASALYKTQFSGIEFFNGTRWSANLAELKHLLGRDTQLQTQHLLESEEYRRTFYTSELGPIAAASPFEGHRP